MARSEARIFTAVWADDEFRALSRNAQGLYFFLLSQPDLAYDGVLALRERKWSRAAEGLTEENVISDLARLAAARFVVVDEETEEVLVRTLIRSDGIYRQPNLLLAAKKHLPLVESKKIREALAEELVRILREPDILERSAKTIWEMLDELGYPSPNPSESPSPNPSRRSCGEGGVVTAVTTGGPLSPVALSPLPASAPQPRVRAKSNPAERVILDATDATPDEAVALAAAITRDRRPRNPAGLLRAMAKDGDLADLLALQRAPQVLAAARDGPPCPHEQPGGASLHPTTNEPLCPLCRRDQTDSIRRTA